MIPPEGPPGPSVEPLVEAVAGAWRPHDARGAIRFHPQWYDLDEPGRVQAYEAARASRLVESALDPLGLSSTARAVMARIRGR